MKAKSNRIVRRAAKFAATRALPIMLVIALLVASLVPYAQPKRVWAQEPTKEPGPPPEVVDFVVPEVDLAALAASYQPPTGVEAQGSCFPLVGWYFFEDGTPLFDNDFIQVDTERGRQFLYRGEYLRHPTLGYHIKVYPIENLSAFYWVDGCKAILGDDSCEPNQTPSSPCHIGVSPASHSGKIVKITDYDYIRAWVAEGQTAKWRLYSLSKDLDIDAWVWSSKASRWEFLGQSVKSGTQQEIVFTPVNGQALLVLRIYAYQDPAGGTGYSLEVTNTLSGELAAVPASLRVLNTPFSASTTGEVTSAAPVCSPTDLTGSWLWQAEATATSVVTTTAVVTATQLSWCGDEHCIALPIIMRAPTPPPEPGGVCSRVPRTVALHTEWERIYGITAQADEAGAGMIRVDSCSVEKAKEEYLTIGKSVQSDWAIFPSPAYSPDYEEDAARFFVLLPLSSGMDPFSMAQELDVTAWWLQMIWDEWNPGLTVNTKIPFPTGGPFFSRWNTSSQRWMGIACPGICPENQDLYVQLAFLDKQGLPNQEFFAVNSNGDIIIQVHMWRKIPGTETFKLVSIPCENCMGSYTYVRVANILAVSEAAAFLWLIAQRASGQNEANWQNFRPPSGLAPQPAYNMRIYYGLTAVGFALIAIATFGPDPTDLVWLGAASHFGKMALSPQARWAIYEQAKAATDTSAEAVQEFMSRLQDQQDK